MAERRMFAKTIVLSDSFLDMSLGARCLYMTLGMLADDDGFVNNPRSIMRTCGSSDDDMKILIAKKFILPFDDGVIVIKHWRVNNYLRSDRYTATKYKEHKAELTVDDSGVYHRADNLGIPSMGIPNDGIPNSGIPSIGTPNDGIPSIGKVSIGKDSLGKDSIGEVSKGKVIVEEETEQPEPPTEPTTFTPPTKEEIINYCKPLGLTFDIDRFYDFYSSNGWMVRGRKMRDWQAACRYWASTEYKKRGGDQNANMKTHDWDYDKIEEQASQLSDDWLEKIKRRAGMT